MAANVNAAGFVPGYLDAIATNRGIVAMASRYPGESSRRISTALHRMRLYFRIPRRANEELTMREHLLSLLTCSLPKSQNELHSKLSANNREMLCTLQVLHFAVFSKKPGLFRHLLVLFAVFS